MKKNLIKSSIRTSPCRSYDKVYYGIYCIPFATKNTYFLKQFEFFKIVLNAKI